ncbi:hypothetical protein C0J52_10049 [Blattella germanica]|nr:hypothetical protein C0J52_10049 [Blattella germanica]
MYIFVKNKMNQLKNCHRSLFHNFPKDTQVGQEKHFVHTLTNDVEILKEATAKLPENIKYSYY